jgi:hypothetical protein
MVVPSSDETRLPVARLGVAPDLANLELAHDQGSIQELRHFLQVHGTDELLTC